MEPETRSYVRAALGSSWRSTTLLFWVAALLLAFGVLGASHQMGATNPPPVAAAAADVFQLRSEALLVAAEATRGVDVSVAAENLAARADTHPAATDLAATSRALAAGEASAADLAAAADRLLLAATPPRPLRHRS
jgi:hypothetical protein